MTHAAAWLRPLTIVQRIALAILLAAAANVVVRTTLGAALSRHLGFVMLAVGLVVLSFCLL